jgi:sialate O-acetylesterase
MKNRILILFIFVLILANKIEAKIILPKVISNNMVLQSNKPVAIWGRSNPSEKISVKFLNQNKETVADANGKWIIYLDPMKASFNSSEMIISGEDTIIKLNNILIGEVWLCSGQSNMEYPLDRSIYKYKGPDSINDKAKEALNGNRPDAIRVLYIARKLLPELPTKGWVESKDTIIRYSSAIGYLFAKELYEELNVPVGIISSSWGGTKIEEWTPPFAYKESPKFKDSTLVLDFTIDGIKPGKKFEGMIFPLIPYTIKGVLWYQGESNMMIHDSLRYADKFKLMIETWRKLWNQPDLPFYYAQIAPFYYTKRTKDRYKHTPETLPITWEAQLKCMSLPNVGMIVTTDLVNNLDDIHPFNKWDVAHRFALWALAKEYDKNVVYSGPIYKSMKIKKNKIILSFDHCGSGLISKDGKPLSWFTISGSDGKFVEAKAIIKGCNVEVSSKEVKHPVAVRFAWNEAAQPNFFNKEGLPASPFRTDSPEWNPY